MAINGDLIDRGSVSRLELLGSPRLSLAEESLVSCLMVTRGHVSPGRHAIDCYRRQTYPCRELVIVVDDLACPITSYVSSLNDASVRIVAAQSAGAPLGDLRNLAVSHARGEFVCQWDDDDLYDPSRISVQLGALVEAKAQACILGSWTLWWPEQQRLANASWRLWEGSILARKSSLPRYPALRRGEDTVMVSALLERHPVVQLDAPELYIYVHHGANTFGETHFREIYNWSRARWVGAAYRERLALLGGQFPIACYLSDLGCAPKIPEGGARAPQPLVSIVVRSMGRPELARALASLAAQEYPRLEVIVVDATGGKHPPLPALSWRKGHSIRLVGRNVPLKRPHAANVGLEEVAGEWFGFLDDDDDFDADHLTVLVNAGQKAGLPVVYGLTRLVREDASLGGVAGLPFNRALMFMGPLFCFPAALVRREVIDWGCRFDEAMEISEDRDFFAEIASRTDFGFVDLATFNYRVELGTSGTGQGGNQQRCRNQLFEQRLRTKRFGAGTYHCERALRYVYRALGAYGAGDAQLARTLLERALAQYPGDPNAMSALGALMSEAGESGAAEQLLRGAVKINPGAGDYRLALAVHFERTGDPASARREALAATTDALTRAAAEALVSRLGSTDVARETPVLPQAKPRPQTSRLAPCPCNSGKRYRDCCGALTRSVAALTAVDGVAIRAIDSWRIGEADRALQELQGVAPGDVTDATAALGCAALSRDLGQYERAYAFLARAEGLGQSDKAFALVAELCDTWQKQQRRVSLAATIRDQIQRLGGGGGWPGHKGAIHVICSLSQIGGTERQALSLYRVISSSVPAELWSVTPPLPAYSHEYSIKQIDLSSGRFPRDGHLVFVGTHYSYGDWLHHCQASRVTIAATSDVPESLVARLIQFEEMPPGFRLDLTFPSEWFRDLMGLPGDREYPLIDVERFSACQAGGVLPRPFTVGRHSRSDSRKFHPNDPAFFRRLADAGYRLRILGGGHISRAMSAQPRTAVELLPEGSLSAADFLASIDCFVYRVHPACIETCGMVVLEAMAAALPVVLFGQGIGAAELIRHGENGFLVSTEGEALEYIAVLAEDPELRRAVGRSARQTVAQAMRDQEARILLHYQ